MKSGQECDIVYKSMIEGMASDNRRRKKDEVYMASVV